MRAVDPILVKERIHGNFPETGQLGLPLARAGNLQTIVRHSKVESVRPESISIRVGDGNGRSCTGIVKELGLVKDLEGLKGIIQEWRAESLE